MKLMIHTRPDIIKMAPLIKEIESRWFFDFEVIDTRQHYDANMSDCFSEFFNIKKIKKIEIRNECLGKLIEASRNQLGNCFRKNETVVVYGDTVSALASALCAKGIGCHVIHVEAGLRSYDLSMPEEIARVLIDGISEIRFCPLFSNKENLIKEGLCDGNYVVGNLISESIKCVPTIDENMEEKVCVTIHRPENADDFLRLERILMILEVIPYKVNFFAHPRVRKNLDELVRRLKCRSVIVKEPYEYSAFVKEMTGSKFVITDSGGIQEETALLGIPCVTFRKSTERPETIDCGNNILIDVSKDGVSGIVSKILMHVNRERKPNPSLYGEGVAKKIVDILVKSNISY